MDITSIILENLRTWIIYSLLGSTKLVMLRNASVGNVSENGRVGNSEQVGLFFPRNTESSSKNCQN